MNTQSEFSEIEPSAGQDALRVLLVEDNPSDAALILELLADSRREQWWLRHETRIEAAKETLSRQAVDVILLDLKLPDASGLSGLEQLLKAVPLLPIIVLTGAQSPQLGIEAIAKGAQDYLLKDELDRKTLARTIRHGIERQRIKIELDRTKAQLERFAVLDPLTELLNRRGLEQALVRETKRAERGGWVLAAVLIDLDDFKRINDSYGHAVGDLTLREIAGIIQSCLRPADCSGRIGGDEFLVLLPETRLAEAIKIAERLRLAVSQDSAASTALPARVTASLGIATIPVNTLSITEVLYKTQSALHQSKSAGKNRSSHALMAVAPEVETPPDEDMSELLLRADSFQVLGQPLVRLADGEPVAFELLSRGPAGPLEMPNAFFPYSFENNILTNVDLNCLRACLKASHFLAGGHRCHVNIFPSTLLDTPPDQLRSLFTREGPDRQYCVEVCEQQILGDPLYLKEHVNSLQAAGILVALDDVGFGRSSLESLILLEPDIVKIDKRLVTGVAGDETKVETLRRLLAMTYGLKSAVIVEGIESRADRDCLADLGVEYGQGYLFGRPSPINGYH